MLAPKCPWGGDFRECFYSHYKKGSHSHLPSPREACGDHDRCKRARAGAGARGSWSAQDRGPSAQVGGAACNGGWRPTEGAAEPLGSPPPLFPDYLAAQLPCQPCSRCRGACVGAVREAFLGHSSTIICCRPWPRPSPISGQLSPPPPGRPDLATPSAGHPHPSFPSRCGQSGRVVAGG